MEGPILPKEQTARGSEQGGAASLSGSPYGRWPCLAPARWWSHPHTRTLSVGPTPPFLGESGLGLTSLSKEAGSALPAWKQGWAEDLLSSRSRAAAPQGLLTLSAPACVPTPPYQCAPACRVRVPYACEVTQGRTLGAGWRRGKQRVAAHRPLPAPPHHLPPAAPSRSPAHSP